MRNWIISVMVIGIVVATGFGLYLILRPIPGIPTVSASSADMCQNIGTSNNYAPQTFEQCTMPDGSVVHCDIFNGAAGGGLYGSTPITCWDEP